MCAESKPAINPPLLQTEEEAATISHVWNFLWLTPARCRLILAALIGFGFVSHLIYLTDNCPIDLSGDEAHYWDWSRRLDISYYSKGPLVAWLIRASCAVFGDVMWAVRLPALILAAGTTLLTYWLARRMFDSDRVALGAVALTHLVPMFVAGSLLMTIDPPFYFCWAAATCLAVKAIFDRSAWAWPAVGAVIGIGFLAKYAALLWFVGLAIYLLLARRKFFRISGESESADRSSSATGFFTALGVAMLFTIPVIFWNARNGWVSLGHVAKQTGATGGGFDPLHPLEVVGSQIGVVGPTFAVLMIAAVLWVIRSNRESRDPRAIFLLCIGLPFFTVVFLASFFAKIQVNWPAPTYFTLTILTAGFISTRMSSSQTWRRWRGWVWATVVIGLLLTPLAHDMSRLYPWLSKLNAALGTSKKDPITARKFDPTVKLRGWEELGLRVSIELQSLAPGGLVMAEDYQTASQLAFYVQGQPNTFAIGSYYQRPTERKRWSQFDLWPDRALDQPALIGRDAIYVGFGTQGKDLAHAFASVERLQELKIVVRGVEVRSFRLWRCKGFKGMTRPAHGRKL